MFCMLKKRNIYPACISKHNSKREKKVTPLMIPNGKGWHCLEVKILSALLREVTPEHHGDFYCLNCLHSFATENKGESRKNVCENKNLCNFIMPSEDTNILEFNQYQQSDEVLFLLENTDGCKLILKIHPQQKLNLNKKKLNLSTIEQ